jgi:hemerythrin-like domain-containing protein
VLARLEREHAAGERAIRQLQHTLLAFEMMGEPRRAAFEASVAEYLQFYLDHMELEEEQILPAALQYFSDAEWAPLDAAFASNADPLAGHAPAPDYEPLFRRILRQAEAPLGYGPGGV